MTAREFEIETSDDNWVVHVDNGKLELYKNGYKSTAYKQAIVALAREIEFLSAEIQALQVRNLLLTKQLKKEIEHEVS